jgi:hypothetical protein
MTINELVKEIQSEIEWLSTTQGDEIECIGIENLEGILSRYLGVTIKLTQDEFE